MPEVGPCFSYPAGAGNEGGAPSTPRRMPANSSCFRYPPDASSALSGVRRMPTTTACFHYQAEAPPNRPNTCFSYPPGLRQMPTSTACFRY
jgi:hypothetical protein